MIELFKFNHSVWRPQGIFRKASGIRRLGLRDKRGVTAVIFALSATAVIGLVGLGTEGGLWVLTRRNAQDAA
ncbi:MAG: hypothetical protein IRY87_01290, partial [Acetobacteraceae bacterium]|nr:hypothetical protein [Acetobacteraceae bacterium]